MPILQKKEDDIVVMGMGLMGASLAYDLMGVYKKRRIIGYSRSTTKIRQAVKKKIITCGDTDPSVCFQHASMVIIATPVGAIKDAMMTIEKYGRKGVVVTDVGSTKKEIVQWADTQKFTRVRYVGSHPLAGSHKTGMEHVMPGLYKNAVCVVTPTTKSHSSAVAQVKALWQKVGSKVVMLAPQRHDALLAASSHFPHVLAYALVSETAKHMPDAFAFAGTGFKDTTRIAESGADIWCDIVSSNKEHVLKRSKGMIRELERLNHIIEKDDRKRLIAYFEKARKVRGGL